MKGYREIETLLPKGNRKLIANNETFTGKWDLMKLEIENEHRYIAKVGETYRVYSKDKVLLDAFDSKRALREEYNGVKSCTKYKRIYTEAVR